MKKSAALLFVLMAFLLINSSACASKKEETMSENDKTKQQENLAENKKAEEKVEKPVYMITATQGGEELGKIKVEFFPETAPKTCAHLDQLISSGFYDGLAFHRVIPGFMIQGGDPNSKDQPRQTWGVGGNQQKTVPAEFSKISHKRGILSMARKGNDVNSATSQFFIVVKDSPFLDGQYTVFGKVLEGMEVADKIVNAPRDARDNPNEKIEMKIEKVK